MFLKNPTWKLIMNISTGILFIYVFVHIVTWLKQQKAHSALTHTEARYTANENEYWRHVILKTDSVALLTIKKNVLAI